MYYKISLAITVAEELNSVSFLWILMKYGNSSYKRKKRRFYIAARARIWPLHFSLISEEFYFSRPFVRIDILVFKLIFTSLLLLKEKNFWSMVYGQLYHIWLAVVLHPWNLVFYLKWILPCIKSLIHTWGGGIWLALF